MEDKHFYHLFANGDDAKNFITSEQEFKTAFNRFGVCAHSTGVVVVSFSVEDSHPHGLLWGTAEDCAKFKVLYETMSIKSIVQHRGSADGVCLHCELYEILDGDYLKNVATYTIVQATKDGKAVMPYDYLYGTGSMYFRSKHSVSPWLVNEFGVVCTPVTFGSLSAREKLKICGSRTLVPDDWLVCNGFILPENYVDVSRFEAIYVTHNCFRAFLSSGKNSDTPIMKKMATVRGVSLEDLEARRICEETCLSMFGKRTSRHLDTGERLRLAQTLRQQYGISFRQLSFLARLPESELRKYIR